MPDGDALSDWVRKSLRDGDSPDIIKAALKNRGYDPHIVDIVNKSFVAGRKEALRAKLHETKPMPAAPKHERAEAEPVDLVPVAPEPQNPFLAEPAQETEAQKPAVTPVYESNPQKEKFRLPLPALPAFDIKMPKLRLGDVDLGATRIITVGIAILLILVAIVLGLNWYADMMVKSAVP